MFVRQCSAVDQCDNFKALGKIYAGSSSSIHQSNEVKTQYYIPMEDNIQLSLEIGFSICPCVDSHLQYDVINWLLMFSYFYSTQFCWSCNSTLGVHSFCTKYNMIFSKVQDHFHSYLSSTVNDTKPAYIR